VPAIRHRNISVEGRNVFVREAGDPRKPSLVLLPGFPSSTRAYIRLIDRLANDWHAVAIDYPGFGSSAPLAESPTFDRLAEITGQVIDALGIGDYVIYMFDFGAPVGFRTALRHDDRVRGIVSQNGNAYLEGFGPGFALSEWWRDREAGQSTIDAIVTLAGTQSQWNDGARDLEQIDPEQALADQRVLDLPGRASYMKALLWDYQNNVSQYGAWQAWLRERQPALLAIWGANDPIFAPPGAEAYKRDVADATVVLLDTGHFALEEDVDVVAHYVGELMKEAFDLDADGRNTTRSKR
jgi:pimeloyl-ACP methyl ester carboxylesterase